VPALEVSDVAKSYGSMPVFSSVSLAIAAGEAVGIVGPNGAGKTTLLNLLSGTGRCDAGRVLLQGKDVTGLPPPLRARMGLGRTFQVPRPLGDLTVFENALVGATRAAGLRGRHAYGTAYEALTLTGMAALANARAGSLRLLDRKRLELARALATAPRLLLLDEVAGGLTDPEVAQLVEIVLAIRAGGVAVIWIEHVVRALTPTVQRLLCLAGGTFVGDGAPADVLALPAVREVFLGTEVTTSLAGLGPAPSDGEPS
jgi:branched-chain amino acid transport system ATP-binding protein